VERILLGQLGANGDCLYATILARQLRADHPAAHIVWAISSHCAGLLANNPHVDEVWEIPVTSWDQHEVMWRVFEREALRRYIQRDFDHVLLSQIWPNNFQNYDGTVRPSILRSYGRPITVPIENVINLSEEEIQRVETFVREHRLKEFEHKILFECSSKSGQSFVTPGLAQEVARHLYKSLPDAVVLFSTHLPMKIDDNRSLFAGSLSLREVAHLTQHCSLFVGAGSGNSGAASSTAAKPLPMIQLLSASTSVFALGRRCIRPGRSDHRKVHRARVRRPARLHVRKGTRRRIRRPFNSARIAASSSPGLSLISTASFSGHRAIPAKSLQLAPSKTAFLALPPFRSRPSLRAQPARPAALSPCRYSIGY
jgi:hypothetical protein